MSDAGSVRELTPEQLKRFHTYKHIAPKTTLETFYVDKFLVPLEKLYPSRVSANTITLLGQGVLFFYVLFIMLT